MEIIDKKSQVNCAVCNALIGIGDKECRYCGRHNNKKSMYNKYSKINILASIILLTTLFSPLISIKIFGIMISPTVLLFGMIFTLVLGILEFYYKFKCSRELHLTRYEKAMKFIKRLCIVVAISSFIYFAILMSSYTAEQQSAIVQLSKQTPTIVYTVLTVFTLSVIVWLFIGIFGHSSDHNRQRE